jgi:hypothetical protein
MQPTIHPQVLGRVLAGLLLLLTILLPPGARADEPRLAVRLIGGESAIYALGEIERIGFEGQETLVVVTGSGSQHYATEMIARIEFLWDFSSVEDPEEAAALIKGIHLFQNQPNPFSPQTQIAFELPHDGQVELSIYAPDGRLVRSLASGQREAGRHTVSWDGRDDAGRRASGGVYFYSLRAPGIEESRRMILLP